MSKGLRTISDQLYELCKGNLEKNCILCCGCRKLISHDPSLTDDIISTAESSGNEVEIANEPYASISGSDSEGITSVFTSLDLSPPKKRKLKNTLLFRLKGFGVKRV